MISLKKALFAILGLGVTALSACTTGPEKGDPQDAISAVQGYRLGAGDEIKITVYGEQELSGPFVVDGQGTISMSLIGQIQVINLTLDQAGKLIETKLKDGWLRDPKVTAEMVRGRPYYILGEVNKPGEYPFVSGLTVMNAVASAGDFTYRADKHIILIKSTDSANEREVELTPTTTVRPGDTIRVRERFF